MAIYADASHNHDSDASPDSRNRTWGESEIYILLQRFLAQGSRLFVVGSFRTPELMVLVWTVYLMLSRDKGWLANCIARILMRNVYTWR